MLLWHNRVLFVVSNYITSDKLLQTWDLCLWQWCCSGGAPNHTKCQFLHDVALKFWEECAYWSGCVYFQSFRTFSCFGLLGLVTTNTAGNCCFWFCKLPRHVIRICINSLLELFSGLTLKNVETWAWTVVSGLLRPAVRTPPPPQALPSDLKVSSYIYSEHDMTRHVTLT